VEYPAGSGELLTLDAVANRLTDRVISLFEKDKTGKRLSHGKYNWFYQKPGNENLLLFYEYFHGDDCHGLGASHQTGWTSLVAELISEAAGRKKQAAAIQKDAAAAQKEPAAMQEPAVAQKGSVAASKEGAAANEAAAAKEAGTPQKDGGATLGKSPKTGAGS
jgi:hypothetical protein